MNGKAEKQQIKWPPQLNLCDDKPHIDSTFTNAEKNNAPFLNDMLQPIWVEDTEGLYVYDTDGNAYTIKDGNLYMGSDALMEVDNYKFVREDVTKELTNFHDIDIKNGIEYKTLWVGDDNDFTVLVGNETNGYIGYVTPKLFTDGVIVASRILATNHGWIFACVYDIDDIPYLYLMKDGETIYNQELAWYKQTIRRNSSTTVSSMFKRLSIENSEPIINITELVTIEDTEHNYFAVSLVSERNKCIDTSRNGFATYLIRDNEVKQLGVDILPTSSSSSVTVINTLTCGFRIVFTRTSQATNGSCISSDGVTYYDYTEEGVIGQDLEIPVTYTPTSTGNTVTIDNVEYTIYNYSGTTYTYTLNCSASDSSVEFAFKVVEGEESQTSESDTNTKSISLSKLVWRGQTVETPEVSCYIIWLNEETEIPQAYRNQYYYISREQESTVNATWLTTPNVACDNGQFYAMWNIVLMYASSNTWSSQTLTTGNIIEESGRITSIDWDNDAYTVTPTEYLTVTSDYNVARGNSVSVLQNFHATTVKLNNASATSSYTLYNNGGTAGSESTSSKFLEYFNSNVTDMRYYPGTTVDSTFNYYGYQTYSGDTVVGNTEDLLPFTEGGWRTPVHSSNGLLGSTDSKWNLLYQTDNSNTTSVVGISYSSNSQQMGTLVTPWLSIDEDFYVICDDNFVIYRDKSNKYYKVSVQEGNELSTLLDDRYILVNTTSYWNMWDSQLYKKMHYATDYNNRIMFGQNTVPTSANVLAGANTSGALSYARTTATAINSGYRIMPRLAIASIQLPYSTRSRVFINAERPYASYVEESSDTQGIDIYYSNIGGTTNEYRYTLYPYPIYERKENIDLSGSTYTVSTTLLSPNIFSKIIVGSGNKNMVQEDYDVYTLVYYSSQPFLLYSLASRTTSLIPSSQTAYFVLQGQFYAFKDYKIYSMIYSDGSISSQDPIVDAKGMVFIGNNTQIAFFFSPSKRMFYSFTGDAILTSIYNGSKFSEIIYNNHWYDEMTQSIFVPTDKGLLVFGQKNTWLIEDWNNVTNIQISTDGVTHITNDGNTYNMVYYYKDGYKIKPIEFETSFYGLGNNEYTSIDRWEVTLYDNSHLKQESWITVGVRSITDITVKSEEKTFKITPDMYDDWSDSVLIRYVPKLMKGQGIRLYLNTPLTVQKIVPHIMDMGTGTLSKRGL